MKAVLQSVLLPGVVAAIVSYLVAKVNATATIASAETAAAAQVRVAEINASVEREKLAHERQEISGSVDGDHLDDSDRTTSRAAFVSAMKAGRLAGIRDAELDFRRHWAGDARTHLVEAMTIIGESVSTPEVRELLEALDGQDEQSLDRAADLWPLVEEVFISVLPRRF